MTRRLVAQQTVYEVASALVAEGFGPSILVSVTHRWHPVHKGQEFVHAVWVLACKEAQRKV